MSLIDWPETKNYFSFYGLMPVYEIDSTVLKKLFLEKSRSFHPDFFGDDVASQTRAIEVTAYNNKAFKVLSQPLERIKYLVQLNESKEEDEGKLPQDFLMEMMDLNELIDEFAFAENKDHLKIKIETEMNDRIQQLMHLLIDLIKTEQWSTAKSELLKLNYLERLASRLQ